MNRKTKAISRLYMACALVLTTACFSGCSDPPVSRDAAVPSVLADFVSQPARTWPPNQPAQSDPADEAAPRTPLNPADSAAITSVPPPDGTPADEAAPVPFPSPKPTAAAKNDNEVESASAQASMDSLVLQFKVSADRYYNDYGFSSNRYPYTQEELKMLAVVIYMEARGESNKTRIAVGNVVMNRVLASGYAGDTIREVVTAPNQFCYDPSVTPSDECIQAALDVLKYETWVVPQNAYFFRMTSSTSAWGNHPYCMSIGSEAFYLDNYSGRYTGEVIPDRLFERTYKWPQYGCKPGTRVRKIQIMLKAMGYKIQVDGYFGEDTKKQVIKFQKDCQLTADGIAGPATLRALIGKYGVAAYLEL